MDLGIQNKVYLIAGGSKGLGLAIARYLVKDGARVCISSRDGDNLKQAKEQLVALSSAEHVASVVCDVTNKDDILRWVEHAVAAFGGVDGLVVNAGGPPPGQFDNFRLFATV
jgi:3-oxoacyl-[acyl-carrier protein] reductase